MEANRKRAKVHMLPTEDTISKGCIYKNISGTKESDIIFMDNDLYNSIKHWADVSHLKVQHLYFTIDEEIKEGDWYYSVTLNNIFKATNKMLPIFGGEKIIASTDPKLTVNWEGHEYGTGREISAKVYLPQPSEAFIKAYCEQGGIDEVDVECERIPHFDIEYSHNGMRTEKFNGVTYENTNKIKVDPVHNTITTHRIVEKMYSLEDICKASMYFAYTSHPWTETEIEAWVKAVDFDEMD